MSEESNHIEVRIEVQADPLAFVFQFDDGRAVPALLSEETALGFAIQLLETPRVSRALRLPGFVQRLMMSALWRSWERQRFGEP